MRFLWSLYFCCIQVLVLGVFQHIFMSQCKSDVSPEDLKNNKKQQQ